MKEQVLSIKQMKELEELGIDTSNASMFWHNYNTYSNPEWEVCCTPDVRDIPTFTLQDILNILENYPKSPYQSMCIVRCKAVNNWICCVMEESFEGEYLNNEFFGDTPIEAAFEFLKDAKLNNYI